MAVKKTNKTSNNLLVALLIGIILLLAVAFLFSQKYSTVVNQDALYNQEDLNNADRQLDGIDLNQIDQGTDQIINSY